jgi:quercetin dioxygenase-like cupin family protein
MNNDKKSAVSKTRRLAGKTLSFLLGEEDRTLREFAAESKTGRAAKTLVKQGSLRITLVALKKGTALEPHQVTGPVSIQTIRGCLEIRTEEGTMAIPPDGLITLDAGVAHSVTAHEDSGILITLAM